MKTLPYAFGVVFVIAAGLAAQAPGQPAGPGRGGRGQAPDPQIYPGDSVVVDGSAVKAAQKQILQSIPLLSIFGPL